MSSFLQTICDASRDRVREAQRRIPLDQIVARANAMPNPPPLHLDYASFDLIAEVKKASPAAGELSQESDAALVRRAIGYAHAGAAAVSVLTEPTRFGGELAHLEAISAALRPLNVPAMRKDFIVDVYQVFEAAAAGAGGVLAILRVLDDSTVMQMLEAAGQTRMFVLLEAFDADDLRRAHPFVATYDNVIVGLNSRNLSTLDVDYQRLIELADAFPTDCLRVAESGIATADDIRGVRQAGYQFALVGTALMRSGKPQDTIVSMLAAARA